MGIELTITREDKPWGQRLFGDAVELVCLGRGPGNDVELDDDQVSRSHAALVRVRKSPGNIDRWFVRDLSSPTGVTLDERAVIQAWLPDGARIGIGPFGLELHHVTGEPAPIQEGPDSQPNSAPTVVAQSLPWQIRQYLTDDPSRVELVEEVARRARSAHSAQSLFDWLCAAAAATLGAQACRACLYEAGGAKTYVGFGTVTLPQGSEASAREGKYTMAASKRKFAVPIAGGLQGGAAETINGFWCIERPAGGAVPFSEQDANFLRVLAAMAMEEGRSSGWGRVARAVGWPMAIVGLGRTFHEFLDEHVIPAARSDVRVMLLGERGVGKSSVAKEIHRRSPRREGPFERPENVTGSDAQVVSAEMELFGAYPNTPGIPRMPPSGVVGSFEKATDGVLFFDEVAVFSPQIQERLLTLLGESEGSRFHITRMGSGPRIQVDVRVVSATNANLDELARTGGFRTDLLDRLAKKTITVPPLRKRREDIPVLVHYFLDELAARDGKSPRLVSHFALQVLSERDWPGNVRELRSRVEAAYNHGHPILLLADFELPAPNEIPDEDAEITMQDFERKGVVAALKATGGNITAAAKRLKVGHQTMRNMMDRFAVARDRQGPKNKSDGESGSGKAELDADGNG